VRTQVTDCNGKDRPARVRGGSAHSRQGQPGAEREKKKSPGRDISTQRQKVRIWVTDHNGKDRPAKVRGGSAHTGRKREFQSCKRGQPRESDITCEVRTEMNFCLAVCWLNGVG